MLSLSIGSNVSTHHVETAIEWLRDIIGDFRVSRIYETPEIHGGSARYVNAVAVGSSNLSYDALNALLKEYEVSNGRDAAARAAGRVPIDIDIVVWNGQVVRPRDFRHSFFRIGYSELAGSPI